MGRSRWFPRFGDVAGVGYEPLVPVDARRLPGHDIRPTVSRYDFDGRRHVSLMWRSKDGETSQSPASQHEQALPTEASSSTEFVKHLCEVLELPGTLTDYHFAIQGCAGKLWSRRREELTCHELVERLSWLDIRLVEAHPDMFKSDFGDDGTWPAILGFGYLIRLYSREGYLHQALDVASRATMFKQHPKDYESLRERVALLEAEEQR